MTFHILVILINLIADSGSDHGIGSRDLKLLFFEQISWRHNLFKKVRFGRKKTVKVRKHKLNVVFRGP